MQNFEDFTPEMLVFYQNLPQPVQNAVRHSDLVFDDLETFGSGRSRARSRSWVPVLPTRHRVAACVLEKTPENAASFCGRIAGSIVFSRA